MRKCKIFFGSTGGCYNATADTKFNEWIEKNPDVGIISVQYMQVRYGDHSIFVLYDDNDNSMIPSTTFIN